MQQRPVANKGTFCPLWRKDVSKVCHTCEWWIPVKGHHPQTNEVVDQWGCAIAWAPHLLTQVGKAAHQGGAATESLRNTIVEMASPEAQRRISKR